MLRDCITATLAVVLLGSSVGLAVDLAQQPETTIAVGGEPLAAVVAGVAVPPVLAVEAETPDQKLTTVVQDQENPVEPWEVTTYRKPGESLHSFIRRHRDLVEAVRDAVGGGQHRGGGPQTGTGTTGHRKHR